MIRLTPPTVPGVVSSGWGASRAYRGGWHAGLDFFDKKGAPMLAAADGTVAYVKNHSDSYAGKYTVIDHGDGIFTRYLHANANYKNVGDKVHRGEVIGEVGTTGTTSTPPHVHFDVKLAEGALARFLMKYGQPITGFSALLKPWGQGVPAETFMDKATYKPGVKEQSLAKGVKFYAGISIGAIALIGGGGYLLYRYLTK